MSRRKHQAAKTIVGENAFTKRKVSQYGAPFAEQIFSIVEDWNDLFLMDPNLGNLEPDLLEAFGTRQMLYCKKPNASLLSPTNLNNQVRFLLTKLSHALTTGNAQFFREFADAIERFKKSPIDRLRHWLSSEFVLQLYNLSGEPAAKGREHISFENSPPTIGELKCRLEKDGIRVDDHFLRRVCKEMGIELAPAKRGRPTKSQ